MDFRFEWNGRSPVRLDLFDVQGRLVRRLEHAPGARFTWDGRDTRGVRVASGVYYWRLEVGTDARRAADGRVLILR